MFKSGLKIRLTIILTVLMLIGVLISNLITILFTQREMVRNEFEHVQMLYEDFLIPSMSVENISDGSFLKEICEAIEEKCLSAQIYLSGGLDDIDIIQFDTSTSQLKNMVTDRGQRVVELSGSVWEAFWTSERYLLIADRLVFPENDEDIIVLVWNLSPIYSGIKKDQRIILVYLLVNVLFLSVIGFFRMAKLIVRPIDRLIGVADQFQLSNSVFYAEGKEHSEFGQLNTALNNMVSRIESDRESLREHVKSLEESNLKLVEAHNEIVRAEKLASVGRLSAGFAHEIGNPLAIIQGYIELLKKSNLSEELKQQYGARAVEELDRINGLIRKLLDYARESTQELEQISVDDVLLEGILDIVDLEKDAADVKIQSQFESGLMFKGSREGIRQVLLNCILNSIDAIKAREFREVCGFIEVVGTRTVEHHKSYVLLGIKDNGLAVTEEQLKNVFDPFFSTKQPGKGTGLGLYVSHAIVESFDGRIWMETNEAGGTVVWIKVPASDNSGELNS